MDLKIWFRCRNKYHIHDGCGKVLDRHNQSLTLEEVERIIRQEFLGSSEIERRFNFLSYLCTICLGKYIAKLREARR